jgi:hypothetical protein
MPAENQTTRKSFLALIAILSWFGIIAQFFLALDNRIASIGETIVRFISFFTIESNALIAVASTTLLLTPSSRWGRFFAKTTTLTALTLYILVVGITYNALLRSLWNPQGLQRIVDEILHSVIPVLFFIFWLAWQPKQRMQYNSILPWLLFPLLYCIYTLILGPLSGYYPYPFMDAGQLGMPQVLINSGAMVILFVVIALALVWNANRQQRR